MFFGAAYLRARQKCSAKTSRKKNPKGKKKKHVRHVNIFMVIPHNLRNALGSTEIFKMDCICIREGVEKSRGRAEGDVVGKRILHAAYEIDMQMLYEARGFFSLRRADLKFWLSLLAPSRSLSFPRLFHWLRWWCTYCLLVNMIKIQISHYGKFMWVCVSRWNVKCGKKLPEGNSERRTLRNETYTLWEICIFHWCCYCFSSALSKSINKDE